jgi:hypothetical protein
MRGFSTILLAVESYSLSRFCVDTTVEVINSLHRLVYPDDDGAIWLEISVNEDGQVVLEQLIEKEIVLQI